MQSEHKEFSEALKIGKFEAKFGWQFRFCERYGITWKQISGKDKGADVTANEWNEENVCGNTREIPPGYIFNANEIVLFFLSFFISFY